MFNEQNTVNAEININSNNKRKTSNSLEEFKLNDAMTKCTYGFNKNIILINIYVILLLLYYIKL